MNKLTLSVLVTLVLMSVLGLGVPAGCQTDPSVALQQAQDMITAGNCDGAIDVLEGITSSDALVVSEVQRLLGDCYRIKQDYAKAAQYYQVVLDKTNSLAAATDRGTAKLPSDLLTQIHRGLIACHIRLKIWDKVANEIDATSSESPSFAPWWYYALGCRYLRSGDYAKGATTLSNVISYCKDNPSHPVLKDSRRKLAECFMGAGEARKALDIISGLEADYKDCASSWHYLRGKAARAQGNTWGAIDEFENAVHASKSPSKDLDVKYAREQLVELYRAAEKWDVAIPHLQTLLLDYPKQGAVWELELGRDYMDSHKIDQAIATFKDIINRFPDATWRTWDAHFYLAKCLYPLGRGQEAMNIQDDFYAARPKRAAEGLMVRGRSYLFAAHNTAEAQKAFEEFLRDYPHDSLARDIEQWYIECQAKSGKVSEGRALLLELAENSSTPKEQCQALSSLAYCSYLAFDWTTAKADFERMYKEAKMADYRSSGLYMVGDCYTKLKDYDNAKATFQKVVTEFKGTIWERLANDRMAELPN